MARISKGAMHVLVQWSLLGLLALAAIAAAALLVAGARAGDAAEPMRRPRPDPVAGPAGRIRADGAAAPRAPGLPPGAGASPPALASPSLPR